MPGRIMVTVVTAGIASFASVLGSSGIHADSGLGLPLQCQSQRPVLIVILTFTRLTFGILCR